jgi:predicted aspartyl protease
MRNHRYILLLAMIMLVSSCSYFKNVKLLIDGEIKRKNYVQTIPFEWRKELIVVRAKLNSDTVQREFIFDTGAFNSKVESSLANRLGLDVVTEKTNSTAQGISKKIEVVRVDSLQLGETTIYNLGAGKLTYAPTSASPCIASSGIIGANLIKLAHWKIDYENQLLHFSDSPFDLEEGSYILPFDRPLLSGTPQISLEVQGKKAENVLFDVGYNGGLILPLSLASHFRDVDSKIILDQSTSGIYGTNTDSLLVKNLTVDVAGVKAKIPVEFSSLNKALIGNEFLKHFTVVINYQTKEIYLKKQQDIYVSPPLHFSVAIQDDSLWMVSRTSPEIPLELGETLLSINGKKPNALFRSHCDHIMNLGKLLKQDSLKVQKMDGSFLNIPYNWN